MSSVAERRKAFESGAAVRSAPALASPASPRPLPPGPRGARLRSESAGGGAPPRPPKQPSGVEREAQLEQKILDLQMQQLQLVERLATYEQYMGSEEGRTSGSSLSKSSGSNSVSKASGAMLNKLRGNLTSKLEKSQKKKEAQHALDSVVDMDAEFWSQRHAKRRFKVDLEKLEVLHPLTKEVGGSLARLFVVEVGGLICVMKELDINFAREFNASLVRTFESEVQFLENLPSHPNIVRYLFHTFDHERGRARLFMTQYAMSLRDEIVRRKRGIGGDVASGAVWCSCCPKCAHLEKGPTTPIPFDLTDASRILLDIAQGLSFLHNNKVLHRDLKSDNIFIKLGPDGEFMRACIGDFDSAKNMREMTKRISTAGTPGYIAPEVWSRVGEEGTAYTYSSDVYSFGILVFEILTFSRPFETLRGLAIQEQLLDTKKTYADLTSKLTKRQISMYDPLLRLFSQCTSTEPSERPAVSFVIMALKNILGAEAGGQKSPVAPRK